MKFICDTKTLAQAVISCAKACAKKSNLPLLTCVLISANDGKVIITGYDCELGITTKIDAKVPENGSICLDAKTLSDILLKAKDDIVTITTTDFSVILSCGNSEYQLIGGNAKEYPALPEFDSKYQLKLNSDIFASMVSQTVFAVSTDTTKVHSGIKFEVRDKKLTAISTDGFRLAIRQENINDKINNISFVVPAKSLNELLKLAKGSEDITLSIGLRHISVNIGNYNIISRLLDGEFLDYNKVIPKQFQTTVAVETQSLIESIERTSLVIRDKIKFPLKFEMHDNLINLNVSTSLGTANDEISADIQGNEMILGVNPDFLYDVLRAADTDRVKLLFNSPTTAITIKPMENDSFIFIVLPVRLKG